MAALPDIPDGPHGAGNPFWLPWRLGPERPPLLTRAVLDALQAAGLETDVILDLRHNRFFTTFDTRAKTAFQAADPGLSLEVSFSEDRGTLRRAMLSHDTAAELAARFLNSDAALKGASRPVRLPVSGPHRSLFRLRPVPEPLRNAMEAVNAAAPAQFNALPESVRCAMGLYKWHGGMNFSRIGGPDLVARTA